MIDDTKTSVRIKRCSRGENCIHPEGPDLPVTAEYWYLSKGKPGAMCRECAKIYRRNYHQDHREHENSRSSEYMKINGGKYKEARRRYRARVRNGGNGWTHEELDTLYRQQKGCCWYCGKFVSLTFDIDHRVPVSRGGTNDISNLVIACPSCNRSKHDKLPHEWNGRLL